MDNNDSSNDRNKAPITSSKSVVEDDDKVFVYTGGRCLKKLITHAIIDKSVTVIERGAFAHCMYLKYVEFPKYEHKNNDSTDEQANKLNNHDTGNDRLSSYTTRPRLTVIETEAFLGCQALQHMDIPSSVKKIGDLVFRDCFLLKRINFNYGDHDHDDDNSTNCSQLEEIGNGTFMNCSSLVAVDPLPASIKNIGNRAFSRCYGLSGNLTLPPMVEEILPYTFHSCDNLESVTFPPNSNSLKRIGEVAFSGCCRLVSINLPNSVERIDRSAFSLCNKLAEITLPKNLKEVGHAAFQCSGLEKVYIHNGLEKISDYAFASCSNLSEVLLSDESDVGEVNVKFIGARAFYKCERLRSIDHLIGNVKEIGASAFACCSELASVTIPETVLKLGAGIFQYCGMLSTIILPQCIQSIPSHTFYRCDSIEYINIPPTIRRIQFSAFQGCTKLSTITFSDANTNDDKYNDDDNNNNKNNNHTTRDTATGISSSSAAAAAAQLYEIENRVFFGCIALESIELPNSICQIGDSVFGNCINLQRVTFGNAMERIGYLIFRGQNIRHNNNNGYVLKEFKFSILPFLLLPSDQLNNNNMAGNKTTITTTMTTTTTKTTMQQQQHQQKEDMEEDGGGKNQEEVGTVCIKLLDDESTEIIRKIQLYTFVCDYNRGGGQFLKRHTVYPLREFKQGNDDKDDNDDDINNNSTNDNDDNNNEKHAKIKNKKNDNKKIKQDRQQISYPSSLWPLILNRLMVQLTFPSYTFFKYIIRHDIFAAGTSSTTGSTTRSTSNDTDEVFRSIFDEKNINEYDNMKRKDDDDDDNDDDDDDDKNENGLCHRRLVTVIYHLLLQGIVTDLK